MPEPVNFIYGGEQYLCREVEYAVRPKPELDGEGRPIPSIFTAINDNWHANVSRGVAPSVILVSPRFKELYDKEMEKYLYPPEARMFFKSALFMGYPDLTDDEMYILSKDARLDTRHNSHVRMEAVE